MNTGKVEFAPDYKSKSQVRRIAAQKGEDSNAEDLAAFERMKQNEARDAEHARLQLAVVEAAKVYCRNRGYGPAERSLMASVDALIAFEAEHKIGDR